jgi:hypothetical protein
MRRRRGYRRRERAGVRALVHHRSKVSLTTMCVETVSSARTVSLYPSGRREAILRFIRASRRLAGRSRVECNPQVRDPVQSTDRKSFNVLLYEVRRSETLSLTTGFQHVM